MPSIPALNYGDKIGVFTASDPIIGTEAQEWVLRGQSSLKKLGFSVLRGKTLSLQTDHTAGTDQERYNDFLSFIKNPEIKMILTAMGGENAHDILPLMDFEVIAKNPKIIMGYSDATVFLNPIFKFSKITTFYGYHLASFDQKWDWFGEYDKKCFKTLFLETQQSFEVPASNKRECWKKGVCEGFLVGGSLTDLAKLIGIPWEPKWKDSILILESMNQTFQNIDVYLTHFKQAGIFNKISGLLLGTFHNCNHGPFLKSKKTLKEIFLKNLSDFSFPILKTVDFGHFSHMCPLALGSHCHLNSIKKTIHILKPLSLKK
ncbi:MAG: LD-carboxypeptidase [Bdellovibrionales bacterium]|nr:LD-carboxypeptidase [Bdellovibrionales bacterium]